MPIKKHHNRKNKSPEHALIPTKEQGHPFQREAQLSGQIERPRITAVATAGKRKRPK